MDTYSEDNASETESEIDAFLYADPDDVVEPEEGIEWADEESELRVQIKRCFYCDEIIQGDYEIERHEVELDCVSEQNPDLFLPQNEKANSL